MPHLLVFGLGYTGTAVARAALRAGCAVTGTARGTALLPEDGITRVAPGDIGVVLGAATHLLVTAPPGAEGDPMLTLARQQVEAAPMLGWVGYLSTTGVYGDRAGGWVDEQAMTAPGSERTRRRVTAEAEWARMADCRAVALFRVAGIYGPGRSAFDELRAGRARRVVKPGHAFSRIHRDDIARAVLAAMAKVRGPGLRVFNLADDEPAESAAVIEEAARLLGLPAPPAVPFGEAWAAMSPMARSFWAEDRKVSSRATRAALGLSWRYPSYREGLRAILNEERGESSL